MKRKVNDNEQEVNILRGDKMKDLVSIQLEEWLEEQKLDDEKLERLTCLSNDVKKILMASRSSKRSYKVSDMDWLTSCDVKFPLNLPFGLTPDDVKSLKPFSWKAPDAFNVMSLAHMFQPNKSEPYLHVEMIIPKEIFGDKDFLNFAYHVKRALYLCWAAKLLRKAGYYVEFVKENYDALRHCLMITEASASKDEAICLHVSPSREIFKVQRFCCSQNNLRHTFCFKRLMTNVVATTSELDNSATPLYNATIMEDMRRQETVFEFAKFFQDKHNLRKAILIANRWLRCKRLSQCGDGFSELLLNAWFIYLFNSGIVNDEMPIVNCLTAFFHSLSKINGFEQRHSLCQLDEEKLKEYKKFYEFVLVDSSGFFNIAYALSSDVFARLCIEAVNGAMKLKDFSEFESLFLTNEAFSVSYDIYIRFRLFDKYMECEFAKLFPSVFLDSCGNYLRAFKTKMLPILRRCWLLRVNLIEVEIASTESALQGDMVGYDEEQDFIDVVIGAQVLSGWDTTLIRGPPAKTIQAQQFREFWGEKCELRKFPDNAICEAVLWDKKPTSSATLFRIFQYIMHKHLKLSDASFIKRSFGFGLYDHFDDSRYDVILKSYEKLSQVLRDLQDLPLLIAGIHPVSGYLRRTLPVPPFSSDKVVDSRCVQMEHLMAFPTSRCSPLFLQSIEVHLTMEQSGKWGEDLDAIAHLKAAFYIAISKILKIRNIDSVPYFNYLLVMLDTVVFRLIIVYPKEGYLMKVKGGVKNGVPKDNIESKLFEQKYVVEPKLAAYLYSVSHQHPAFSGTCRLVLRWLSAHMLSDYINDIIVEVIVAAVFVKPLFLSRPQTVYLGFLHSLILLSQHEWLLKPLIVDFNGEWTESDKEEIEAEFIKLRPVLPAMVVCTPADRSGTTWTREEPQPLVLKRILHLAASTIGQLQKHVMNFSPLSLKSLFIPQLSVFDAIIYLHTACSIRKRSYNGKVSRNCCPVIDYNPARSFLNSLEECFHTVALFFFDKYGEADKIGVIWRRNLIQDRPANISNSLCRRKVDSNEKFVINLPSIIEDFTILGGNIVDKVVSNNSV